MCNGVAIKINIIRTIDVVIVGHAIWVQIATVTITWVFVISFRICICIRGKERERERERKRGIQSFSEVFGSDSSLYTSGIHVHVEVELG